MHAYLVGLVDGLVHHHGLVKVLPADVDVRGASAHREAGEKAALHELVRVLAHDLAVLSGMEKKHADGGSGGREVIFC